MSTTLDPTPPDGARPSNAPQIFRNLTMKARSPFQRRQVFLVVIALFVIALGIFYLTSWGYPISAKVKPWKLSTGKPCARSILGKELVADEHGYTCPWQDSWMQPSGCCDQGSTRTSRFSCESCDSRVGCCGVYELCVSCCLKEDNLQSHFTSDRMKQLAAKDKEIFNTLRDPFELCQMVCRTSSRSLDNVDGTAVFRSETLKYCFEAAPVQASTQTGAQADPELAASVSDVRFQAIFRSAADNSHPLWVVCYYLIIALVTLGVVQFM